jgi:hypothetical protein
MMQAEQPAEAQHHDEGVQDEEDVEVSVCSQICVGNVPSSTWLTFVCSTTSDGPSIPNAGSLARAWNRCQ